MSNFIVDLRFKVDVPEAKAVALIGRPDDGSDNWYRDAAEAVEMWCRENSADALELAMDEPDVEAT